MKKNTNSNQANTLVRCNKVYMHVNVILTFDMPNAYGERQEFFDLQLPLSSKDTDAVEFLNKKLFKRIVKKCELFKRNVNELTKISTASNWALYEEVTKAESLTALGHNCKWHFGMNRDDLDEWEKELMSKYGFGTNVDMSWLQQFIDERNKATAQSKAKSA